MLEVGRVKTEWNFIFYGGLKSPYYFLWGQNCLWSYITLQGYAKQSGPHFFVVFACQRQVTTQSNG